MFDKLKKTLTSEAVKTTVMTVGDKVKPWLPWIEAAAVIGVSVLCGIALSKTTSMVTTTSATHPVVINNIIVTKED